MLDKGYLCTVKNYSPHLAFVYISEKPIENEVCISNPSKNFGYKHHYLNEGESISFKILSHSDDMSMSFSGTSKRFVSVGVRRYYYTVWLYINGEWRIQTLNKMNEWNGNIYILNRW